MTKKIELSAEELVHVIASVNQSFYEIIEESMQNDLQDRKEEKEIILKLLYSHIVAQHQYLTEALNDDQERFANGIIDGINARRASQEALKN